MQVQRCQALSMPTFYFLIDLNYEQGLGWFFLCSRISSSQESARLTLFRPCILFWMSGKNSTEEKSSCCRMIRQVTAVLTSLTNDNHLEKREQRVPFLGIRIAQHVSVTNAAPDRNGNISIYFSNG